MATSSAVKAHDVAHAAAGEHEHLSAAPLIVGVGALFMYLGAVFPGVLTAVGILTISVGFLKWIREDVSVWNSGWEMPGVSPGRDLGWWAMVMFLCTEVMLFGGLFAVYFVQRSNFPAIWERDHEHLTHALGLVGLNTAILLSSSVTLHFGHHAIRKGNRRGLVTWLLATILLGAVFLGIQVKEYITFIFTDGLTLGSSAFGSIFFQITGTHGFHVFLGLVFLTILLVRALMGQFTAERHTAVEAFSIYWHFVDVVWVFVFTVIYLGVI